MDEKMIALYETLQKEIARFTKVKREMENPKGVIGAEGIIRGLQIALDKIIESDKEK